MKDKYITEDELEDFIQEWHSSKKSRRFATEMGLFMFEFLNDIHEKGLSEKTLRKHENNCELIGKFIADYGYHDKFSPEIIGKEPDYINELKRKISDSDYMVNSYKSTWRKLAIYASARIK